jgi:hypothetical protein
VIDLLALCYVADDHAGVDWMADVCWPHHMSRWDYFQPRIHARGECVVPPADNVKQCILSNSPFTNTYVLIVVSVYKSIV